MATAIQKNGMKPLTNGSLNHVENVSNLDRTEICSDTKDVQLFQAQAQMGAPKMEEIDTTEIDIVINNVVCSFSVRCHLNLREIALNGSNVEYRRENGMITMKLRRPYTTASIWSSGKVTCTGATSEDQAKVAARRFARSLQKLGFKVRFNNFRVVNVLGTCCMPFAIKITSFSVRYKENADYEPELHPAVTYKLKEPKATLKIFSTGSVTVTAPNVASVQAAIEYIFPLVYEFRKERTPEDIRALQMKKRGLGMGKRSLEEEFLHDPDQVIEEDGILSEEDEVEPKSDASWD
ncbi:TATA box-binding protein-like protein 1 [Orussus abietinus]|uniref:TATA box-binding protein-like protein 1 n=1 Tax=Orussus abietinus TaxID=222816 RepID=UPI0006251354|nr:TATA box-binding protein-like protein 1 [Orussus abietinus]XP_012288098.1 TATA box-binding protein-like protein 1 [Orussus abietinus]XP_023288037.1 TATA box-binding protein-like protein 1 [Orussus abietinus]